MPLATGTALLIGSILSALGTAGTMTYNAIEANKNRNFQAEQANINRNFQKEMRDTTLISSVNQAKELGISPSLVLGQGSNSIGGAMASGSQASSQGNMFANTTNALINHLNQEDYLRTIENINREKNETMLKINEQRMNNSANGNAFITRNYSKEDLENLYDDLDKIKI